MSVDATILNGSITNNGKSANTSSISKAVEAANKEAGGSLDKDAFLQLLVTQMQYQNPLEPTDNTEYISQLATFSELEEMQNMSSSMDMQRASGLVGQYVYLETTDSTGNTKMVEGTVDYVSYSGNKTYLSIDGVLYDFDDLKTVADSDYTVAVKLADSFSKYLSKLPKVANLTDDNLADVEALVATYSNMSAYQKSYLTEDELKAYNEYALWYSNKTGDAEKEVDGDKKVDTE